MRSTTDTKVNWTLAVLFLLLLLSAVVLIAMIGTVRRGTKDKAAKTLLSQLNAAWGESLPASLKVMQMTPPSPGPSAKTAGPAFIVVKARMTDEDALKLVRSGE